MKKAVSTEQAPAAIGPYSQAIAAGNMIFISGQLPVNPKSGEIPGDISGQAEVSLSNIKAILEAAGCTMENVVEVGVFLKDMNDFAAMNEVYARYFEKPFPARAAVEVSRLPKDVLIEIKAIAVK